MACCYIAVFMISCVVEACETLDIDIRVQYNESIDPGKTQDTKRDVKLLSKPQDPTIISVTGMTCAACTDSVETSLSSIPGVHRVSVSLLTHDAKVIHDSYIQTEDLKKAVEDCGFDAEISHRTVGESVEVLQQTRELKSLKDSFYKISRASSLLFLVNNNYRMLRYFTMKRLLDRLITPFGTHLICLILTCLVWGRYGSWIHRSTWKQARRGAMNMNTLITISSTLGILLSISNVLIQGPWRAEVYWQTTVGLIMVVTAGRYVDVLARKTGAKSLASLYSLVEDTMHVTLAESQMTIPTSMAKKSDTIRIEAFDNIPCDCYVVSGSSLVNESIVTGESVPKIKKVGDFLIAGTRNGRGDMVAMIHETEQGSFLTQMLDTVETALGSKVRAQESINVIIRYFVLAVIVIAVAGSWACFYRQSLDLSLLQRVNVAARQAMTILAVSCPCALGLSTPCAITAGIDVARRKGILMTEGASTMEKLSQVTHIVMDKTGTVTQGQLQITSCELVDVWQGRWEELCTLICAAEENHGVAHPAGLAVFRGCLQSIQSEWQQFKEIGDIKNQEEIPGSGLRCSVNVGDDNWRKVCIGNAKFMQSLGIAIRGQSNAISETNGSLKVYVAVDSEFVGVLGLQDALRVDAREAIQSLQDRGLGITMATGDIEGEAQRVSSQLGIKIVTSSALPETKLQLVKQLQDKGEKVAMIGDGINDAPSLAAADVGIMMAHAKQCLTTGGNVMLLSSELKSVPALFFIAKNTMAQLQFNLLWVLGYNVLALSLALGIGAPWNLHINPSIAAAMMSFSSISVTMLGIRLRHWLLARL